jgi:hypothetical protein
MGASEWATESGKGLVDIFAKGAGGGGILGLLAGIAGSYYYSGQPAKFFLCPENGSTVQVEADVLGRPKSSNILCQKVVDGPFGDWSSGTEAALQAGIVVLLVVFVGAVIVLIANAASEAKVPPKA